MIWELALSHAECHGICCFCSEIINYCLIVYFCRFNISHFSNFFLCSIGVMFPIVVHSCFIDIFMLLLHNLPFVCLRIFGRVLLLKTANQRLLYPFLDMFTILWCNLLFVLHIYNIVMSDILRFTSNPEGYNWFNYWKQRAQASVAVHGRASY